MTDVPSAEKPLSPLAELAKRIHKTRERVFEAQSVVHLCVHACHSGHRNGVVLDYAATAFELLYRQLAGVADQLGELVDVMREPRPTKEGDSAR